MEKFHQDIRKAARMIMQSENAFAFTGAGISVESGIPPFRGENGIWNKYDPKSLDLNYFYSNPLESWAVIKKIFYDFFGEARFNRAHEVLAMMEKQGYLKGVVTQNIDNLHFEAGSRVVHEFHGNMKKLVCTKCHQHFMVHMVSLENLPPSCSYCEGLLKPDFVFFGENIPYEAFTSSFSLAEKADVVIVVGTTGEVVPASHVPLTAKQQGARIIEINMEPSNYTHTHTDVFLKGKASEVLHHLFIAMNHE